MWMVDRGTDVVESYRCPGGRSAAFGAQLLGSVLDRLGDPVLVVGHDGRVVWFNAAMAGLGLVGSDGRTDPPRCCDVLDCRANTHGEPEGCLTATALAAPAGIPPRRIWIPVGDHAREVWLSTIVPADGDDTVAFQLWMEASVQSARLTPAAAPSILRVAALGPLVVEVDDEPRGGDWLQQRPGELFKFLLCARGRPATTETIAGALWPNRGPSAIANVRYFVHRLREYLERRGGPSDARSLIIRRGGGYLLDPDRLLIDVAEYEMKIRAALPAAEAGVGGDAEQQLEEALVLYRDDFLSDLPYAEWAFAEREYLRGLAGRALRARGDLAAAADRLDDAARDFRRLAQLEPFDTDVQERLIEVCLRRGRRSEAMRHYAALRVRLMRAFGDEPDFDLAGLAARMSTDRATATR
jgi:DNA-binding SARP family transcriptional activator